MGDKVNNRPRANSLKAKIDGNKNYKNAAAEQITSVFNKKGTEFDNDPSNPPLIDQCKSAGPDNPPSSNKDAPKAPLLLKL